MTTQYKYWTFTDYDMGAEYPLENFTYLGYGEEVAPTTQRRHRQGFCETKKKVTRSGLLKWLKGCHVEPCKGNREQNMEYITKEGKVFEHKDGWTEKAKDGWTEIKELAKQNKMKEIIEEYPEQFIRCYRGIEKIREIYMDKRQWKTDIWWYWSHNKDTGKTHAAMEVLGDFYMKQGKINEWNNYDGQERILWDDIRFDPMYRATYTELFLNMGDRTPWSVRGLYICKPFLGRLVIVTSNYPPEEFFPSEEIPRIVGKRITRVVYFKNQDDSTNEIKENMNILNY